MVQIVKPREISGKILTLVEEAVDELIVVSPYLDISRWTKVQEAFRRAKERGVLIDFYLREDQHQSVAMVQPFAHRVNLVYRLHAKLYWTNKAAVFTSMNLVQASDEKSTDLGLYTEDENLLSEFRKFVETYLTPLSSAVAPLERETPRDPVTPHKEFDPEFHKELGKTLKNALSDCQWTDGKTYWFSGNAVDVGDLMINRTFVWKIYKNNPGSDNAIDWFRNMLTKAYQDKTSLEIEKDHDKFTYLTVEPLDASVPALFFVELIRRMQEMKPAPD